MILIIGPIVGGDNLNKVLQKLNDAGGIAAGLLQPTGFNNTGNLTWSTTGHTGTLASKTTTAKLALRTLYA